MMFRAMPVEPPWKPLGKGCIKDATHTRAFSLLRYELGRIGATDVVIEAGFRPDQIRNDGLPYSSAKPIHSTVRITFRKSGVLPLSFTAGGHADWFVNLYLIAMTLERLRAIDRYACTQGDEQYRGFSSRPPGGGSAASEWSSIEDAMRYLCRVGSPDVLSVLPADLPHVYHAAAKKAHPDAGGNTELMSKVNRARDFVEHGGR